MLTAHPPVGGGRSRKRPRARIRSRASRNRWTASQSTARRCRRASGRSWGRSWPVARSFRAVTGRSLNSRRTSSSRKRPSLPSTTAPSPSRGARTTRTWALPAHRSAHRSALRLVRTRTLAAARRQAVPSPRRVRSRSGSSRSGSRRGRRPSSTCRPRSNCKTTSSGSASRA